MRRLAMGIMVSTFCVLALGACSDEAEEAAAMEAKRVKLYEEFQEYNKGYMELLKQERAASSAPIKVKKQLMGAQTSGNESLAAELQGQYDAAVSKWEALQKQLTEMESKRDDMMDELRELGHEFGAGG